jgi:hypothetical protein
VGNATIWVGVSSSVVAVAAIAAALRDRRRLLHEREAQQRADRREAYATMARLTKAVWAEEEAPMPALAEAHSETEMLTDNTELKRAADVLLDTWANAWNRARQAYEKGHPNPIRAPGVPALMLLVDQHRSNFVRLAKEELNEGLPRRAKLEPPPHLMRAYPDRN